MTRFSPEVEGVLREAGWTPERRVEVDGLVAPFATEGLRPHRAAIDFLAEFAGLDIQIRGPGVTRAREPFELDPSLCEGEEGRFADWGQEIGHELFPIGELDNGRYFLGIDENGEVYVIETWVASFGVMPDAMENLVRGVAPTSIRE
jgi:hypothetical protein